MLKLTRCTFVRKNAAALSPMYIFARRGVVSADKKDGNNKVSNIKKYWFGRFVNYVKNYETVLEKNFPRTMHVYRIFSLGTKAFYLDLKKYISVIRKQSSQGIDSLTREELQLHYTLRQDIVKISPVLLISAVPFTNYVIFPLAYYYPRYLLTSHYWTLQQRLEFLSLDHQKRVKHNIPLFKSIQAEVPNITEQVLVTKWNDVIACLGSGSHPDTKDIIYCSQLFKGRPYGLDFLKRKHLKGLLGLHGMSIWRPFRKDRLMERGTLIKRMDTAIQREGGVTGMSNDAIQWALSFRGLHPANMSMESMREWLDQWLTVSANVNESTMSLLLHCPILLAYNHPNSWILVYK